MDTPDRRSGPDSAGPAAGDGDECERDELERRIAQRTAELEAVNRELAESRRMLQLVLDTIPARVFWKDRESVFLGANQRIAEDAGVQSPEALKGTTDYEWPWREFAEEYRRDDREVIETGVPKLGFIEPQRTPSGGTIWLRTSKIPLRDPDGAIVGMLGTYEDITESHEAQEKLRSAAAELRGANAELERAARLKDEFLATMSHELRTPLSAILGQAEALSDGIYGPLGARQRQSIEGVRQSAQHLLALINDILDLSRIEAGKVALEIGPVSVAALVEASVELVRSQAMAKSITVETSIDGDVTTLKGDGRRLSQVLVNLLENAVKFTPEGGRIGVEVRGDTAARTAILTVWDTGIGIPGPDVPRIFEPFVQLDASLSRRFPGTGLGLSIVKRIVALHGGSVGVESVPGAGSRFQVALPWVPEAARTASEAKAGEDPNGRAAKAAGDGSPLVLVVEDDPSLSQLLGDYLDAHGYRIATAFDGLDAVEWLEENRPDAVLMDIQMPRMDGLDATRWIRARPDLAGTPVIVLTALAMTGDEEKCLAAGASAYISKPARLGKVASVLAECLESARGPIPDGYRLSAS